MSTDVKPIWRQMQPADLDRVFEIAEIVHPDFPEDRTVFANRLSLFAPGCLCLERDGRTAGYLVSHPVRQDSPPQLNSELADLPPDADCYYLHDLALLPELRGGGNGRQAALMVVEIARAHGFDRIALIAVNGSASFWASCGFAPVRLDIGSDKLASYGDDSQFMVRELGVFDNGRRADRA